MVEFHFIGDVDEISDEQRKFISDIVEKRGFKNVNIKIQPVGKAGDNYAASVKRIIVENDGESFKMIAKIAPKSEMRRAVGYVNNYFRNEQVMYTEVLPKFAELEKNADIPEEERLRYAKCYGTYMKEPNEIILLEDLEVPGFKILDRFIPLTDDTVRLILKNLAMLHSLSYVLKYQETETFEKFCESLVNFWLLMANIPEMTDYFDKLDADVQMLIDDEKYKNALKHAGKQLLPRAAELAEIDSSTKFSVIKQGDPWTNNIMFRLEDDRTIECCMIDYQLSTLSSPVADIHYMIFNCTDHATRAKHFHDWIDYYHTQLNNNLAKFGLKIEDVYPRHQLDADLKSYIKVSLGQAVMLASVLVRDSEDAAKLTDAMNSADSSGSMEEMIEQTKVSGLGPETIKKFKTRLQGVVDSFIEFGYL
ncbi:uncharacterized protein LOC113239117 [Hyposmocoma kahamanoa]|uniref:uncharacterized protein LOC113239117 n=1 Tax=Hyposmocoma kahamanoa TaxID=1477025 RepID=UPI000E6D8989|nr:uncharacterized protein LOC113239117 [Hyposmocoma kahamanoa]